MKISKFSSLKPWLILFGGLVVFVLSSIFVRFRIDLTEEKRYSLHPATEQVLAQMATPIHVEILLVGENLPGGMRRLQKAIEETVRTFNSYSPEKISFSYFDPLSLPSKEQEDFVVTLNDYGINPTNLFVNQNAGQQAIRIFPGFLVSNDAFETGALVLKGERGMSSDEILNQSIENLEFELSNAIKKLIIPSSKSIAMLIGNGEMQEDQGFGMVEALDGAFELFKVPLDQAKTVEDIENFELIFIQSPKEFFSERALYLLDQYVMGGGNLVVMLDGVAVDVGEAGGEGTLAIPVESGLEDLLFKYGVRVNNDLIQDLNSGYFPVMAGNFGNQEQLVPLPWLFYVQASRMQAHPITRGLDVISYRFVSSLDTIKSPGIIKTPLIFSSDFSRKLAAPVRVAFQDAQNQPTPDEFLLKNLPLAYLLEGNFTSLYKNRFIPDGFVKEKFKDSGNGKVVVFGDGEVFQSQKNLQNGRPLLLGEDPFSQTVFANKILLRNLVQYLTDPEGIIVSRTRIFQIRPLNKVKVMQEKYFWQILNILSPVLVLVVMGLIVSGVRKQKFSKK